MKTSAIISLCAATIAAAAAHPNAEQFILQDPMLKPTIVEPDEYLIELSPGETRLVTEDEKWALRRVRFIELHQASRLFEKLSLATC
jgi:leucyl aminopeptidase